MKNRAFKSRTGGFTLIEILVVMTIIAALAGLVIASAGYVQKKAARSRAESEIAALSGGCENYKADFGTYPRNTATDALDSGNIGTQPTSTNYKNASLYLYEQLSGDTGKDGTDVATKDDGQVDTMSSVKNKVYFEFRPDMLGRNDLGKPVSATNKVLYLRDPFGMSYGYSTINPATSGTKGYNPTFDLWCTGGETKASGSGSWVTNW